MDQLVEQFCNSLQWSQLTALDSRCSVRCDQLAMTGSQWSAHSGRLAVESRRLTVIGSQSSACSRRLALMGSQCAPVVGSQWLARIAGPRVSVHGGTPDRPPSSEWVSQVHPWAWMCTRDGATHVQSAVDCRLAHRTAPAWRGSPAPPCQA